MFCNAQSKIEKIMKLDQNERTSALRGFAKDLGCSLNETYNTNGVHFEAEVIRRIQEAARSKRESSLWLVALLSAIASTFSALAAWYAVMKH